MQYQKTILTTKRIFESDLSERLDLTKIQGPLFVPSSSGLNDYLSGTEKPVSFRDGEFEIVHSLAKWKRKALGTLYVPEDEGIFVDMHAIRPEETLDDTHSYFVDQWDWEKHISADSRSLKYLTSVAKDIFSTLKHTMVSLVDMGLTSKQDLPKELFIISSTELRAMYPDMSPEQREERLAREKGAIFITQIGALVDDERHGLRAFDYDDWELNGDLIVYDYVHHRAIELSSMGIRVDADALLKQMPADVVYSKYHEDIISSDIPLSIGGGIGQSRAVMYLLLAQKISAVQPKY
jgi:aspartate--ammonia ligase